MAEMRASSPASPKGRADSDGSPANDVESNFDDSVLGAGEEVSDFDSFIPHTDSFSAAEEETTRSRAQSVASDWQHDDDVDYCPRCAVRFTTLVRRHHCRNCGGVVCENCSRSRLRLPSQENRQKQRVCDACCTKLAQETSTSIAEDLEQKNAVVKQLRFALSERYAECEVFKKVLLELDAESTGDRSLLEHYLKDPESDAASFEHLKARTKQNWDTLKESLQLQKENQANMVQNIQASTEKRDLALQRDREEQERKKKLDEVHDEMVRACAAKDQLVRKEHQLNAELDAARRRVRELEQRRSEEQTNRALRADRWRLARGGSQETSGGIQPMAITTTITEGRSDSLVQRNRLDDCRRACAVM